MANTTVLPEDYEGLKKEYFILRTELDNANQELYVSKRQLKVVEALQEEYQCEIEFLQSEENSQKLKQDEKIALLEESLGSIRSKYNERIQAFEDEVTSKEEEIEKLKAEIELCKKGSATTAPSTDVDKLLEELLNLRHENEVLLENEEELKLSLEILQRKSSTLEEALSECREELLNLKESLSCKRDELMEATDLVQKLNDEMCCMRNELESYKSKPLNVESKGNSLFAEVNDRRVYLQKAVNTMKSEYVAMKQERAKHLNTISHLKKENKTLCERWKMDVEEKEDDQDMVIKSYKDQIQVLENLLERYKKDLAAKPVVLSTGTFSEIEFYQIMLNNKIKELEELREQLKSRSFTQIMLSTSLKEANKETRKWRLEATLKQCQLELKPGSSVSENTFTKIVDKEMGISDIELRQTKKGPHLACKKEEETQLNVKVEDEVKVITINDSVDEVEVIEADLIKLEDSVETSTENFEEEVSVLKEHTKNVYKTENETQTKYVKAEKISVNEEHIGSGEDIVATEEKENVSEKVSRRVTFCETTVSPKVTDRAAIRKNCKRIVLPKPIFYTE